MTVQMKNIPEPTIIRSATCADMAQFWNYARRFALVESNQVTVSIDKS